MDRRALSHINGKSFDILVIGGGASGLGAAWDAASRGYTVALFEKGDFCSGTSGQSTKLIHGGVRYLAQGNIPLVKEALKERRILETIAPHIVHSLEFIIPVYHRWQLPYYYTGISLYSLLAKGSAHAWLSRKETAEKLPGVKMEGLKGGIAYTDGQFDDARMGISLAKSIWANGGEAYNYCEVNGFRKNESGKITGLILEDKVSGDTFSVQGKVVINATGVYSDRIAGMDGNPGHSIQPSRGTHIVLDREFLPGNGALMIPDTSDGRVLFGIPWHGKLLLGTTDVPVNSPEDLQSNESEIQFILDNASRYLSRKPEYQDIKSIFSGLRPLFGNKKGKTKDLSRGHKITVSSSGLVSMLGGKWTTFRKMAEDAVNIAMLSGRLFPRECRTRSLTLDDVTTRPIKGHEVYGKYAEAIQQLVYIHPEYYEKLHPDLPYTLAEAVWCRENEMAVFPEDVLFRRLRCGYLDRKATEWLLENRARWWI